MKNAHKKKKKARTYYDNSTFSKLLKLLIEKTETVFVVVTWYARSSEGSDRIQWIGKLTYKSINKRKHIKIGPQQQKHAKCKHPSIAHGSSDMTYNYFYHKIT